jgi:hypothetical protein
VHNYEDATVLLERLQRYEDVVARSTAITVRLVHDSKNVIHQAST